MENESLFLQRAIEFMRSQELETFLEDTDYSEQQKRIMLTEAMKSVVVNDSIEIGETVDILLKAFHPEIMAGDKQVLRFKRVLQKIKQRYSQQKEERSQEGVEIRGCYKVYCYQVEGRQQFVYIIGEEHREPGNSIEFLKELSRQVDCPIDVLIEKSFTVRRGIQTEEDVSNIGLFNRQYKQCLEKGKVPKEKDMASSKRYFQKCVKEFQGKVKLWAVDLRKSFIFYWITRMNVSLSPDGNPDKPTNQEIARIFSDFYHCLFDLRLFRTNQKKYEVRFHQALMRLFKGWHPLGSEGIKQILQTYLKTHQDKSHTDFARTVHRWIPAPVVDLWADTILQDAQTNSYLLPHLLDIGLATRLFRILQQNSCGVVIAFVGFTHLRSLNLLLDNPEIFRENDLPILKFRKKITCVDGSSHIPIQIQQCVQKTERRRFYQLWKEKGVNWKQKDQIQEEGQQKNPQKALQEWFT